METTSECAEVGKEVLQAWICTSSPDPLGVWHGALRQPLRAPPLNSAQTAVKLLQASIGMARTVPQPMSVKQIRVSRLTKSLDHVLEDALPVVAATIAEPSMAYHGAPTVAILSLLTDETTRACTFGLQISMKTMMDSTQPIKATESSTHSRLMEPNGTIATAMVTATILLLLSNLMNAHPPLGTAQKTDMVVSMLMAMDGLTSATGPLTTKSNGLTQIMMATATITCTNLQQTNFTSISEEMHSLMMPHNGTIQTATAGAITTKMRLGILTELLSGLD